MTNSHGEVKSLFTAKRLSKFHHLQQTNVLYIPLRWLYQLLATRRRKTLKTKACRWRKYAGIITAAKIEQRVSQRAELSKYPYIVEACTRVPVHYATMRILTPLDIHNMVTRVSANIRIGGCPCHRRYSYYLNTIYRVSRYTHIGQANERYRRYKSFNDPHPLSIMIIICRDKNLEISFSFSFV